VQVTCDKKSDRHFGPDRRRDRGVEIYRLANATAAAAE